jgi:hypothetical protein
MIKVDAYNLIFSPKKITQVLEFFGKKAMQVIKKGRDMTIS